MTVDTVMEHVKKLVHLHLDAINSNAPVTHAVLTGAAWSELLHMLYELEGKK